MNIDTNIDLYTIQLATSTVTIIASVMFVLDTFLRRTDAAGRVWSAAFISGVLSSFAYAAWVLVPGAWWAVAIGNGAIVATAGLLWSGARAYNGRKDALWAPLVGATLAVVAVLTAGPGGGDWAGSTVMFLLIALFSILGAAETLRAPMRRNWTARGLTAMFSIVALFYLLRTAAFVALGPDDPLFQLFFGTEASSFVIMTLIIVTVVSLVILQSERVPRAATPADILANGVYSSGVFHQIAEEWLERANFHDEQLVLTCVSLDDLEALNTAFGRSEGTVFLRRFTETVRRFSAPTAAITQPVPGVLLVLAPVGRAEDALREARQLQRGLREEPIDDVQGLRLTASIGLATTDMFGYHLKALSAAADRAASEVRTAGGDGAVVATPIATTA